MNKKENQNAKRDFSGIAVLISNARGEIIFENQAATKKLAIGKAVKTLDEIFSGDELLRMDKICLSQGENCGGLLQANVGEKIECAYFRQFVMSENLYRMFFIVDKNFGMLSRVCDMQSESDGIESAYINLYASLTLAANIISGENFIGAEKRAHDAKEIMVCFAKRLRDRYGDKNIEAVLDRIPPSRKIVISATRLYAIVCALVSLLREKCNDKIQMSLSADNEKCILEISGKCKLTKKSIAGRSAEIMTVIKNSIKLLIAKNLAGKSGFDIHAAARTDGITFFITLEKLDIGALGFKAADGVSIEDAQMSLTEFVLS